eukprot:gene6204-8543_t
MSAFDNAFDALDNWYEDALKQGMGFKNDGERQAYISSLGDPLKHPMFATETEDLEGNMLVEGIRAIKEEGKSMIELCLMYKEEGNDWMKKNKPKAYHEAFDRYSHALSFLKQEYDSMKDNDGKSSEISPEELAKLHSQVLSNRAQASLALKNYGSCRNDCTLAIRLWPANFKAHYRRSKSLFSLKQFLECIKSCDEGLAVTLNGESSTAIKDLENLKINCQNELNKLKLIENKINIEKEIEMKKWSTVWNISNNSDIKIGYVSPTNRKPLQLHDTLPFIGNGENDTEINVIYWPLLLLYPQYNKFDILQTCNIDVMLVEYLAMVLPEPEELNPNNGSPQTAVDWDLYGEYHVSGLVSYLQLHSNQLINSYDEWMEYFIEHKIIHSGPSYGISNEICENIITNSIKREEEYNLLKKNQNNDKIILFLEVNLACTLRHILTVPTYVSSGAVLSLIVFPRESSFRSALITHEHPTFNRIDLLLSKTVDDHKIKKYRDSIVSASFTNKYMLGNDEKESHKKSRSEQNSFIIPACLEKVYQEVEGWTDSVDNHTNSAINNKASFNKQSISSNITSPSVDNSKNVWMTCHICGLDVLWPYVLKSDASRAICTHNCSMCGQVVCSICAPAGDELPGDGLNKKVILPDYRVAIPSRGLFTPQRVCVQCYFESDSINLSMLMQAK